MKNFLTLVLGLAIAGSLSAQTPAQVLPDFSFSRWDRSPFTAQGLPRNKPAFFVFFDPDCEHCQRAVQTIGAHYDSFRKAEIYMVSVESQDKVRRFMQRFGRLLKDRKNVTMLQDNFSQFIVRFGPRRYPAMFLYSAQGKLIDYEDNAESVFRFFKPLREGGNKE